ncbi:MucR family transcriptional regulator [Azospirillum canadense]|uniref:MucR family transcriptional regulator n=1 Tax=Azospirillum canadense TaxID=403962 RepID=UPI002225F724|nr:MucR family transcriptional regulator [Azospirillum canadense]MCW2240658.1 putative transcriptional regulator [Azospirillum canadense]
MDAKTSSLTELTATVAAAFLRNNTVAAGDVSAVISAVYSAFATLGQPQPSAVPDRPTPAVPIKKSVTPDYIVCLEDGKKMKLLKRHLASTYNMTPDDYRARWGLPPEYPMVAPSYAARRSSLAKATGLGRNGGRGKR